MRPLLPVLCLALLLAACEKEDIQQQDTLKPAVSLEKKQGASSSSSAMVVRGDDVFALIFYDSFANLTTLWGIDAATLCDGASNFEFVPTQDVITKDGRIHRLQKGTVSMLVYEGFYDEDQGLPNICAFLEDAPLVAEGEGRVIYTDSDVFPAGRPNRDAVVYRGHGTVYDADGQAYRLHGHLTFVWDGVDPASAVEFYKIDLRPL